MYHNGISIGIEENSNRVSYKTYNRLKTEFKTCSFVDCSDLVGNLRLIKSDNEIQAIRKSATITKIAIENAIDSVKEGTTEDKIAGQAYLGMMNAGGEYPAYPPFVTSGSRGVMGHSTNEHREINKGDIVFLEIGGCYRRYHSAMMRTCYIGDELPPWLKEAEFRLIIAINKGLEMMKPGVKSSDIDKVMRESLSKCSFKCEQSTRAGYSIGIGFYTDWGESEYFQIKPSSDKLLEENMVIHLMPWLIVDEKGGIGMSETVLVTDIGTEILFDVPQKIFCK